MIFVASRESNQKGTCFSLFLCEKMGVVHFSSQPSPAIVGEQAHMEPTPLEISPDPLFSALGGPSVWSWEEDHGRPCGLSKWHCSLGWEKVGWQVGWDFFQGRWRWIWRDVGVIQCVCVFFLVLREGKVET